MNDDAGRTSPSEPWTKADILLLAGKAAFFLLGYAVIGAFQLGWRWRMLRTRFL
jgi:hypothetical protein